MRYIVVPPCHFATPSQLCETTLRRLRRAGELFCPMDPRPEILLTGDVPYSKGTKTLAELGRGHLQENLFIPFAYIRIVKGETGSSREPYEVLRRLASGDRVWVVSSTWHLWVAKFFWQREAKRRGIEVFFVPIRHTGGWRTKLFYGAFACAVRVFNVLGLLPILEKRLERQYAARKDGFQFNGCR